MGGFSRSDEARNPPLPVADIGGCSANEATSFASVSVAKRLCRIVRAVAAAAALALYCFANGCFAAYTSPPPTAEPLLKEKPFGGCSCQLLPIAASSFRIQPSRPRGSGQRSLTFRPNRFFGTFLTQESTVLFPCPLLSQKNSRRGRLPRRGERDACVKASRASMLSSSQVISLPKLAL